MRLVLTWDGTADAPPGWESHVPVLWRAFEPRAGVYDWALIDRALTKRLRPCHLQIIISQYSAANGLLNECPAWLPKLALSASNGKTGTIPNYAHPDWQAAYARAVAALAARYRENGQVVGYWHALGVNQETQAAHGTVDGTDWVTPARAVLDEAGYYDFITDSTAAAVSAWGRVPVYVPGAPNPGNVWGRSAGRRKLIVEALQAGARYQMCGLLSDNDNAYRYGVIGGLGLTDIITTAGVGCAFEQGKGTGTAEEAYWWLLRAAHWGADFVDFGRSWQANAQAAAARMPADGSRWLVFRDLEHPKLTWGTASAPYGQSGEPGPWARGLTWQNPAPLAFNPTRWGCDRWVLQPAEPVVIGAPGLADGLYRVAVTDCAGVRTELLVPVQSAAFQLAPTGTYHRIEVLAQEPPAPRPWLPADETATAAPELAEKVRWHTEQAVRELEADGVNGASLAMRRLYQLTDVTGGLLYRLERRLKEQE